MMTFIGHYNYIIVVILMMAGLYVVFSSANMVKKLVGLSLFQTSVFLLYITLGKVRGGVPPILVKADMNEGHGGGDGADRASAAGHGAVEAGHGASDLTHSAVMAGHEAVQSVQTIYANPLPHVLILTAIVVGVATLAIGLALVVRIREVYGTVEENEVDILDYTANLEGTSE